VYSLFECFEVLTMGLQMLKEVEEPMLAEGLPEGKL